MGAYETTFVKSGNGVAVQVPAEFGFEEGALVRVEKFGRELRIVPVENENEWRERWQRMIGELEALGPISPENRLTRDDIRVELPDRPGL